MLKTVFTMILAGCGDGGASCEVLYQVEVEAQSLAGCEVMLDVRLAGLTDDWPEYAGLCTPAERQVSLPPDWSFPTVTIAARD